VRYVDEGEGGVLLKKTCSHYDLDMDMKQDPYIPSV
jgi:hypothetical protein